MKFIVGAFAATLVTATIVSAGQLGSGGVSSIKKNGMISGSPSYTITCGSGWGVVIRKDNAWTDSSGNTYSDRLWKLSLDELASEMCN